MPIAVVSAWMLATGPPKPTATGVWAWRWVAGKPTLALSTAATARTSVVAPMRGHPGAQIPQPRWSATATQHGWQGAVTLAKDPDPTVRRDFRERVDESWRAAVVEKRNANQCPSQRISCPEKIAGIDSALADLVDWLARDLATGGGSPVGTPPGTEKWKSPKRGIT
ncbi:hypothetical protein Q5425_37440 [Amycolatopsis sp. A133]|uniref:hypothetical protein n=1 Tax=Amycolatopsis sp. A133 TaxID=3064472 RepID=UPI0027EA94DE|nr:hypothetical protein [Amycolatopsis sp. A133]MDQ7809441.1 hypothetical protein [Amycolatopsis sp. A133]